MIAALGFVPLAESAQPPILAEPVIAIEAPAEAAAPREQDQATIIVTARGKPPPTDPLRGVNMKSFAAVQAVDGAIVGPAAMAYKHALPGPLRDGIHNVLILLEEPTVFVNYLLQHKIGKAGETLGRVAVNATVGFGGLIDVAKRPYINLPHRPNGFAYTMGFYGVKPGPYLFVPAIGATTVRDLAGRILDLSLLSTAVGGPFASPYYGPIHGTVVSLDFRVGIDEQLRKARESGDFYGSMREFYLKRRQAEIDALHGKAPAESPVAKAP